MGEATAALAAGTSSALPQCCAPAPVLVSRQAAGLGVGTKGLGTGGRRAASFRSAAASPTDVLRASLERRAGEDVDASGGQLRRGEQLRSRCESGARLSSTSRAASTCFRRTSKASRWPSRVYNAGEKVHSARSSKSLRVCCQAPKRRRCSSRRLSMSFSRCRCASLPSGISPSEWVRLWYRR